MRAEYGSAHIRAACIRQDSFHEEPNCSGGLKRGHANALWGVPNPACAPTQPTPPAQSLPSGRLRCHELLLQAISGKVLAGRVRLRDDSRQGCVAASAFGSGAAACGEGHAPQAQPHPSVNLGFGRFSSEMRESHPFPGVAAATGHVSVAGLQAAQSAAQRLTLLRRGVCYSRASTPRGSPTPLVRPCGPPPHSQLPPSGKMRAPLLLGGGATAVGDPRGSGAPHCRSEGVALHPGPDASAPLSLHHLRVGPNYSPRTAGYASLRVPSRGSPINPR